MPKMIISWEGCNFTRGRKGRRRLMYKVLRFVYRKPIIVWIDEKGKVIS